MNNYNQLDFTKLKPCNYNRKSSESEDKQMLSILSQIDEAQRISSYYKLPNFLKIFKESKSAKKEFLRPDFMEMIDLIKKGIIDSIVCWKLDRLARNMTEGGMIIDLLSSGVLKAIITHDKVYYPSDNVLLMSVEFGQGKQFVKDLSVNVKRGQTKKASMGIPHGCASLGFLNDKTEEKGNRNWKLDEEKFWKIKKIFELFLTGTYSAGKLHKYAIEELKLTTVKRKRIGGNLITLSRIYEILKDPIYAGYFFLGGEKYELDKNLPRIITESNRNKVLQLLSKKNIPKIQHHQSLYSGFLLSDQNDFMGQDIKFQLICDCKYKFAYRDKNNCPKCNKEINKLNNPKYLIKSYYYNVRKKKNKIPYKGLNEEYITKEVKQYFNENLTFSNSLLNWSKKYIHELKDKEINDNILVRKDKENRKNDFENKKRKTRELLRDNKITSEEYNEDLVLLKQEYQDTQEPLKENDWYTEMIEITDIIEKIDEILENGTFESKRSILSRAGSNLVWNEEKLNISNSKAINTLIEGIKHIKLKYPKFEPKNYQVPQSLNEKTSDFSPVFSMMLGR
ncbi:MAG: recombinase family protein [Candidatus Nomurabacteria bacterium]|nr:recombinase family protein [Candidatus Nomurabacteria bacterium]